MRWKPILLTCTMLIAATVALAQTEVSGNVSGDWVVGGSPYIVVGNCTVPLGETLTIHHGVRVLFDGDFYIRSYGTLIAQGTPTDSVIFSSNASSPGAGDWRYVRISNSGASASRFEYCRFQFGQNAVYVETSDVDIVHCVVRDCSDSGIRISGSTALVDHCTVSDAARGIFAQIGSQVTIQYCEVTDNSGDGIEVNGSTATLDWNIVQRNGNRGIYLNSAGEMTIRRDVVAVNTNAGIYAANTLDVEVWNCTVSQNHLHGIFFFNSPLTLGNTIVDRNTQNGLYGQNSTYSFMYNNVWNNGSDYLGCVAGPWDISADPMYVDPAGDYHLLEGSPCVDAGWPGSAHDPDGTRADIGVYYFDQNHPPQILSYGPVELDTVFLSDTVTFWLSAYDPDGDSLRFEWWHEGALMGTDSTLSIQFSNPGVQQMIGKVLDGWGGGVDSMFWTFMVVDQAVIGSRDGKVPEEIWLGKAYPNPFNASVVIPFYLYRPARVKIALYDVLGRQVAVLFDQQASQGEHSVYWEANGIPSGIYFAVLHSPAEKLVGKLVRLN